MTTALAVQETALSAEEDRAARQLAAVKQIISQQTPPKEIRTRKGRGGMVFKYTDGAYVIRTLNEALGHNWDFEADNEQIIEWQGVPFEVRCRGRLTVRLNGQAVTKVQYGSQIIEFIKERDGKIVAPVSIGDCFKGAATDAMKKCASLLGVALDLYDSDYKAENYVDGEAEQEPRAMTADNLLTVNQLSTILSLAKELAMDADKLSIAKFNCPVRELNKASALSIIDLLKSYKNKAAQSAPANGPSRKAMFDRKHSPEIGARFDELVKQLAIRDIKPDEMLREANVALHDSGRKQIKTRYEADNESAEIICNTFEAWIQIIDRKQQESRATQS